MPSCSVFIVCEAPEARGRPAGCSSAWFQRQHLTCMELCVPVFKMYFVIHEAPLLWQVPGLILLGLWSAQPWNIPAVTNSIIPSFNKYILGICCVPGTVLELGHTAVNKTVKTPVLMELMFKWKEVSSQQQVGKIQLSMLDGECSSHWRQEGGWGSCSFKQGKRKALLRRG